ncbi:MAG: sugar kinase [Clostridia bacterium]|nr:sugar kinase [Clostridia bacterium]
MKRMTDRKIVLITQRTRLQDLVRRYNTVGQARFYIEHHGGDFADYEAEDSTYQAAVAAAVSALECCGRLQVVDRDYIGNFLFGERDLVVAVGRDGLVANTLKYLTSQNLIGVNPDPKRWDGVLLPFAAGDLKTVVPETLGGLRRVKTVTLAEARLSDGQTLCGVNDIFIGQRTHASARYELCAGGRREIQSSSGIIVSTGLGSTGWLKSVLTGAAGVGRGCGWSAVAEPAAAMPWDARYLRYAVREPYPSKSTGAGLVFGKIEADAPITVTSFMAENGVIFSDGMERDSLEFNAGAVATVGLAAKTGRLVI